MSQPVPTVKAVAEAARRKRAREGRVALLEINSRAAFFAVVGFNIGMLISGGHMVFAWIVGLALSVRYIPQHAAAAAKLQTDLAGMDQEIEKLSR